ncbi:MAG: hypothetical protein ABI867_01895 [Kofleriaceae bacterium]
MASTIEHTSWDALQALRVRIETSVAAAPNLVAAAQLFADQLREAFSTVVLSRVFAVAPMRTLPAPEQAAAQQLAITVGRPGAVEPATPVLSLLGTAGREATWNNRTTSVGHRAIPLIDAGFVDGAPMVASLLSSLAVDLAQLRGDASVQLRSLPGGLNARFYVPDARETRDAAGRHIIAARDFVTKYDIRTVFGMGGIYVNGLMVVAIVFTNELLPPAAIDRFPAFIAAFKVATSPLAVANSIY